MPIRNLKRWRLFYGRTQQIESSYGGIMSPINHTTSGAKERSDLRSLCKPHWNRTGTLYLDVILLRRTETLGHVVDNLRTSIIELSGNSTFSAAILVRCNKELRVRSFFDERSYFCRKINMMMPTDYAATGTGNVNPGGNHGVKVPGGHSTRSPSLAFR
jgi:hypothetical protein